MGRERGDARRESGGLRGLGATGVGEGSGGVGCDQLGEPAEYVVDLAPIVRPVDIEQFDARVRERQDSVVVGLVQ